MKRPQWFEFQDLEWCPSILRDAITDMLGLSIELGRLYHPILPRLAEALRVTQSHEILDLCSGGGGPILGLRRALQREYGLSPNVCMSDLFPNQQGLERIASRAGHGVSFLPTRVDATRVPPELTGFRTLFSCFHHFPPHRAQAILHDAWSLGRPIGIFEITERSLAGVAPALAAPLVALSLAPFVRPFRWSRLALTYALPVLPALFTFDGVVSNLRSYSLDELRALTEPFQHPRYHWELGEVPHPLLPTKVIYLLGLPLG